MKNEIIKTICLKDVPKDFCDYFETIYSVYSNLYNTKEVIENGRLRDFSTKELMTLNFNLYKEQINFNPLLMDKSNELRVYMSVLLNNLIDISKSLFSEKDFHMFYIYEDFLIKILPYIKENNFSKVKEIYKDFYKNEEYTNYIVNKYVQSLYLNENSFVTKLINTSDLNTYDYLYKYGLYISDTQLKIVDYFNKVDYSKIINMAKTTVDGFIRGIKNDNLDISKKTFVKLYFPLGFEKVALETAKYLEEISGLKTLYLVDGISANKQISFSHTNDSYLIKDEEYCNNQINLYEDFFKKEVNNISVCAGRIFIETFGEKEFKPEKIEIVENTEELASLNRRYNNNFSNLFRKYTKANESSFCIISYPSPEIDEDKFEEIFDETIKLNTLDNDKWIEIQQKMIDSLDLGTKVRIVGKNGNKTNLIVNLHKINEGESNFQNCTADVNIPVGEVFTSPVLKETNGVLHVKKVFLHGLEYKDLYFKFENGMVVDYNCSNFDNDKNNKDFVKEKILKNYDSLPIGEFAIGTNTLAYVMARKYNIESKLDILIAEKTGPHFALGDTCYSHQEDLKTYNPDGKEIVSKDNEISMLRHTNDSDKAYYNCHTDITIPYDEVGGIFVVKEDGNEISIIKDGKFVLPGTEDLNIEGL